MCNYELVDEGVQEKRKYWNGLYSILKKKFRLRFEREYWFCGKKEPSKVIEIKLKVLNWLYDFL